MPALAVPTGAMAQDMVAVERCQLCDSDRRRVRFAEPPFTVVDCADCGLVYVTPRLTPEALDRVYGEDYWKSDDPKSRGYADYARAARLYLKTFRRRLALVRRWAGVNTRVLDVGCAAGYFLQVMQERGHDVYGIEPSTAIANLAQRDFGTERIWVGTTADAPAARGFRAGSFDFVTMWDVLEHIPDPQRTLREIRDLLAPGGRLLLETQNVQSLWARLLGRRWHHYKHTEHLYHFAPATLQRLLADCGFRIVHAGAGHAGKYVSFDFIAERAARLGRFAGLVARPLRLLGSACIYVNPRDELIVVAEADRR